MDREELLPCPFCSGNVITNQYCEELKAYYVKCIFCGAEMYRDKNEDVIKVWNTRAK